MEKKLSDYLHYYIGCNIQRITRSGADGLIVPLTPEELYRIHQETYPYSIRLVLRKIEDMTYEEAIELARLVVHKDEFKEPSTYKNEFGDIIVLWGNPDPWSGDYESFNSTGERCWSSDQFHYLLKQGFDLWNLIDSNLALDAATITK